MTADAARLIEQAYTPRGAEFDGLSMPCAIVFRVDVDRVAVRVDGGSRILELDVFVAHQRPRGEEVAVELRAEPMTACQNIWDPWSRAR